MKTLTQAADSHTHLDDEQLEVHSGKSGNISSGCGSEPTWAESTAETHGRDPTSSWSCHLSHMNRRKLTIPQGQLEEQTSRQPPQGSSSSCPRLLFGPETSFPTSTITAASPLPRHPHNPRAWLPTIRLLEKGHISQHLQSLLKSV